MRFLAERTQFRRDRVVVSICCRTRCFSAVFSAGGACGGARPLDPPSFLAPSGYTRSIPLDPGAANEGASAPSFVTRQFSEVSAADWLRRPSVPTVRWGFLIPEWGSRQ